MSTPSARQENGCWKIRCPRSPAKNSAFGRSPPSAAKNRRCATPMSCASSTTTKSYGAAARCRASSASRVNIPDSVSRPSALEPVAHPLEDRPQHRALLLRQPGLAAEPAHVAIVLPGPSCQASTTCSHSGEQEVRAGSVRPRCARTPRARSSRSARGGAIRGSPACARRAADRPRRSSAPRSARRAAARCRSAASSLRRSARRERVGERRQQHPRVGIRRARGRPPGAVRRSSCRCPPSPTPAPGRRSRARRSRAAPDGGRRSTSPTGSRAPARAPRRSRPRGTGAARRGARTDRPRPRRRPGTCGVPPVASSSSASAASAGRWSASVEQLFLVRLHGRRRAIPSARRSRSSSSSVRCAKSGGCDGRGRRCRLLDVHRERRSPPPSRVPRRAAPRPSSGASRASAARPTRTPCRGGRRSRAGASRRSCGRSAGCRARPAPTRTSDPSPGRACGTAGSGGQGSICRSKAVVLTAFCSSPVAASGCQ